MRAPEAAVADRGTGALLDLDALAAYLTREGLGGASLSARRIGEGHSNVTFALTVGERNLVLRRGPLPPHPPSTHDMLREARMQRALAPAGVPVPHIVAVCSDPAVLGVPFYLMERLDGVVITTDVPRPLDTPAGRTGLVHAAVDALAGLHAVDVTTPAIAALGRPEGYLARQVERFAVLWPAVSRRAIPAVDDLGDWLATNRPASSGAAVVHGDYRLGNLMYAMAAPARIVAILDWEMATLGDPLADLGYLVATYSEPDAAPTPLELTSATRGTGFPRRDDLVRRYVERTGADVRALAWYQALALWKAAIFCEAIHTRYLAGERPGDTFAPTLERGVPVLLTEAARAAGVTTTTVPKGCR